MLKWPTYISFLSIEQSYSFVIQTVLLVLRSYNTLGMYSLTQFSS